MILCSAMSLIGMVWINAEVETLPNTQPRTMEGDLAVQMVDGIDRFFMREADASVKRRGEHWKRDFSSPENYNTSIKPNRDRFMKIIGIVDSREEVKMHLMGTMSEPALVGTGSGYKIFAVRWNVIKGVDAEGLQQHYYPDYDLQRLPLLRVVPRPHSGCAPQRNRHRRR